MAASQAQLDELNGFLRPDQPEIMRLNAANLVTQLSSGESGQIISNDIKIVESILQLIKDEHPTVAGYAYTTLVNCSASEVFGSRLVHKYNVVPTFIEHILDPQSTLSDKACMLLSNITRMPGPASKVVTNLDEVNINWLDELMTAFCTVEYNKKKCKLDYLATFIANLMQLSKVRKLILTESKEYMKRLVTFLNQSNCSHIRRGGIASIIKNCCFQYERHEWLLGGEVDLLTHLLLPLAGGEEFTDEEMDKLPLDLQYLDSDKQRERDPDIRKLLLECVIMLCCERKGRELMRSQNIHLIIDNLIKWETNQGNTDVVQCAENLLKLLVSEETDVDNLMTS